MIAYFLQNVNWIFITFCILFYHIFYNVNNLFYETLKISGIMQEYGIVGTSKKPIFVVFSNADG